MNVNSPELTWNEKESLSSRKQAFYLHRTYIQIKNEKNEY